MADNDVYTVEKLLDKKWVHGKAHYLIQWEGYPEEESTWEPEEYIEDYSLIEDFEAERKLKRLGKGRGRVGRPRKQVVPDKEEMKPESSSATTKENAAAPDSVSSSQAAASAPSPTPSIEVRDSSAKSTATEVGEKSTDAAEVKEDETVDMKAKEKTADMMEEVTENTSDNMEVAEMDTVKDEVVMKMTAIMEQVERGDEPNECKVDLEKEIKEQEEREGGGPPEKASIIKEAPEDKTPPQSVTTAKKTNYVDAPVPPRPAHSETKTDEVAVVKSAEVVDVVTDKTSETDDEITEKDADADEVEVQENDATMEDLDDAQENDTEMEEQEQEMETTSDTETGGDESGEEDEEAADTPPELPEYNGHEAEEIYTMGKTKTGELVFLLKWKNFEKPDIVPTRIAKVMYPQVVIKYYESRLTFND